MGNQNNTEYNIADISEVYKVYVKFDNNGIITAINSSAFLSDTTNWTEIDEGDGDKYHHAQNNYLTAGLVDENGIYNYKLVDGTLVLRTEEDKAPEVARVHACTEISLLKQKLAATDYIAAKIAEGAATREEYAEKLAERVAWRARINELEQL